MTCLEAIEMFAQIAVAIAVLFSARAIKLQKDSIQSGLFSNFYDRANEILAKKEEYSKNKKVGIWCVLFLNHLEYLACLVNNKYISFKLVKLYRGIIVDWYEKVLIGQAKSLKKHHAKNPNAFSELKKLYKKLKNQ